MKWIDLASAVVAILVAMALCFAVVYAIDRQAEIDEQRITEWRSK